MIEPTYGNVYRAGLSVPFEDAAKPGTVKLAASAPTNFLAQTLGEIWYSRANTSNTKFPNAPRIYASNDSQIFQPFVQSRCEMLGSTHYLSSSQTYFSTDGMFAYDETNGWRRQINTTWLIPEESINKTLMLLSAGSRNSSGPQQTSFNATRDLNPYIEWVDAQEIGALDSFSIAALISTASREHAYSAGDLNKPAFQYLNERTLTSCVFLAHWLPAQITFDPHDQSTFATNWTDTDKITELLQDLYAGETPHEKLPSPLRSINIHHDWISLMPEFQELLIDKFGADYQNLNYKDGGPYRYTNGSIDQKASNSLLQPLTQFLTSALTINLANHGGQNAVTLLYTSLNNSANAVKEALLWDFKSVPDMFDWTGDLPKIYEIELEVKRRGYSWGNRVQSVTFGLAVIGIYVGVFSYICHLCPLDSAVDFRQKAAASSCRPSVCWCS